MDAAPTYVLTRALLLRLLALVYLVGFLVLAWQQRPLIGHAGLLPADQFLAQIRDGAGSTRDAVAALPTLFWIDVSDRTLQTAAWTGVALSACALAGATNALLQLALWALYLSFVQIGQLFYGYGWETQLCETGFLAIFLCPVRSVSPFGPGPPTSVLWLYRWLIARIMLGAGLIKLRGDPCWRDLTCLVYHYETQPVPNPLSWWLHARPRWFQVAGTLFNHVVELGTPALVLALRRARLVGGLLCILFQTTLIASGNLSFLNWLTIVPALACLDDRMLGRFVPARLRTSAASAPPASRIAGGAALGLVVLVAALSIQPVRNLLSPHQAMNRSFDPLHLVNTYGAFGSVGRERFEVILEGTREATVGPDTVWEPYEFPCKPGDVARRPCTISPYHYRLDWQLWFAAMSIADREPWLIHLAAKLLDADPAVRALLARDPFGDTPPRWIRAELYHYTFTHPGDGSPDWWHRTWTRSYLRPIERDDPALRRYLFARWGEG